MGVTSLMDLMSKPLAASARIADSRPAPGPLTLTSMVRTPCSCASCAAFCAATCAANGVPLRDPLNPMRPALDHASTLPTGSVMATMVLLNEAAIDATPCGTFFFSFFLAPARRAPAFAGFAVVVAISLILRFAQDDDCVVISWSLSSCLQSRPCADPSACERWYASSARAPEVPGDAACR